VGDQDPDAERPLNPEQVAGGTRGSRRLNHPDPWRRTMTEGLETDVAETEEIVERRDEIVAKVEAHAGRIARELALLQDGDYGQQRFRTSAGEWTLKYEAGDLEYLRFKPKSGGEIYVVSTKQPPELKELETAMADYAAFVEAYNDHVASFEGVLDDVDGDFPAVTSAESVVAERNRITDRIREVADEMAGELHRYEGTDYGEFATRTAGKRWELKWEDGRASYLRVGGEGGVYLVSQYGPASAPDVRQHAEGFRAFVEAFDERVEELDAELSKIEL
jgi:hypothetical protein